MQLKLTLLLKGSRRSVKCKPKFIMHFLDMNCNYQVNGLQPMGSSISGHVASYSACLVDNSITLID